VIFRGVERGPCPGEIVEALRLLLYGVAGDGEIVIS
jgi:hypothetical protein